MFQARTPQQEYSIIPESPATPPRNPCFVHILPKHCENLGRGEKFQLPGTEMSVAAPAAPQIP